MSLSSLSYSFSLKSSLCSPWISSTITLWPTSIFEIPFDGTVPPLELPYAFIFNDFASIFAGACFVGSSIGNSFSIRFTGLTLDLELRAITCLLACDCYLAMNFKLCLLSTSILLTSCLILRNSIIFLA